MWASIMGLMPSGLILFCAVLSLIVPWGIYMINKKLHEAGDPPWQRGMDREPSDMPGRKKNNKA